MKSSKDLVIQAHRETHAVTVCVESNLRGHLNDSISRWMVDGRLEVYKDDYWRLRGDYATNSWVIFHPDQVKEVIQVGSATCIELHPNGDLSL